LVEKKCKSVGIQILCICSQMRRAHDAPTVAAKLTLSCKEPGTK
jgi:hypothetical protein